MLRGHISIILKKILRYLSYQPLSIFNHLNTQAKYFYLTPISSTLINVFTRSSYSNNLCIGHCGSSSAEQELYQYLNNDDYYLYKIYASITVTIRCFFVFKQIKFLRKQQWSTSREILKGELLSLLLIVTACFKPLLHFSLTWMI